MVTLRHNLRRSDPASTYQIQVQATSNGATGSVSTVALVAK